MKTILKIILFVEVLLLVGCVLSYLIIGYADNDWMPFEMCIKIFGIMHLIMYVVGGISFGLGYWAHKLFNLN